MYDVIKFETFSSHAGNYFSAAQSKPLHWVDLLYISLQSICDSGFGIFFDHLSMMKSAGSRTKRYTQAWNWRDKGLNLSVVPKLGNIFVLYWFSIWLSDDGFSKYTFWSFWHSNSGIAQIHTKVRTPVARWCAFLVRTCTILNAFCLWACTNVIYTNFNCTF